MQRGPSNGTSRDTGDSFFRLFVPESNRGESLGTSFGRHFELSLGGRNRESNECPDIKLLLMTTISKS